MTPRPPVGMYAGAWRAREMKTYEVNAGGNRTFAARSKAAVMRVWKTWKRLGHEPQAYEIVDAPGGGVECHRIA